MMHADLIDQEDFRERLIALGLSIPPGVTPEQACELAVSGLSAERAVALRHLVEELLAAAPPCCPTCAKPSAAICCRRWCRSRLDIHVFGLLCRASQHPKGRPHQLGPQRHARVVRA